MHVCCVSLYKCDVYACVSCICVWCILCMCVLVQCMYMCRCPYLYRHVYRPETDVGMFSSITSLCYCLGSHFNWVGLPAAPGICLFPCPLPHCWGYWQALPCPAFYVGARDPNSGFHAWTLSSLPAKSSLQPCIVSFGNNPKEFILAWHLP